MAWAPDYVEVDDLASYLEGINDTVDDVELALAITAASRSIDHHTGRQFGRTGSAELRRFTARPNYTTGFWSVDTDDYILITGAGVEVSGVGTVTVYDSEPVNASQRGRPWQRIEFTTDSEFYPCGTRNEVQVTALWGWSAVPDAVKNATLLQASRFFTRRDAPFGVAGSPDVGSEMRLLAKVDPDVAVILREYSRMRGVK